MRQGEGQKRGKSVNTILRRVETGEGGKAGGAYEDRQKAQAREKCELKSSSGEKG